MDRDWGKLRIWIFKKRLEGKPVTDLCSQPQIDREMFYRWWNRYQTQVWSGLEEKPRDRPTGPRPDDFPRDKVIKLRARYEWGPKKIVGYLSCKGYTVNNNQEYKIICEADLNHPMTQPRKSWGTKRFQREHNNSLWQADFKFCDDDFWMISYQDDHSRFVTGSVKIWNPTGENAMLLLDRAVKRLVFQGRFLRIREPSLRLQEEKYQRLIGTVLSWALNISWLACVGLQLAVKLKLSIKPTKLSLTLSLIHI